MSVADPLKRAFDVLLLLATFPLTLPAMAVIASMVRWKLGSPVLFVQTRPGKGGRPFCLYKFRTMTEARAADGTPLPDRERMTPFGSFLRKTSLDELPELLNVLKGDMSLVGPRPLLMDYLPLYTAEQARRHEVKPGLTGWAQVHGRNALDWNQRFALDLWYVEHRSFWLDCRILLMTLRKVLMREGISAPGAATMPRFTGTRGGGS